MAQKIGIIGYGNMGRAIAGRIKSSEWQVWVSDKNSNKIREIKDFNLARNNAELARNVDTVILAVKPQDFDAALNDVKGCAKNKLIISIAAGIDTSYIEKKLGKVAVIRAMPNFAAVIGESVTCLAKGKFASDEDLDFAQQLFYRLGATKVIDEKMMNAATAISGSGPGYVFDFIETNSIDPLNVPEQIKHDLMKRLERAAESIGFNHEEAAFFAANTTNSSISVLKATKLLPSELKRRVASKGGTTEAALEILHKGGTWEEAAKAALKRAEKLSKKE